LAGASSGSKFSGEERSGIWWTNNTLSSERLGKDLHPISNCPVTEISKIFGIPLESTPEALEGADSDRAAERPTSSFGPKRPRDRHRIGCKTAGFRSKPVCSYGRNMGEGLMRNRLINGKSVIKIKENGANSHKRKSLPATNILNEKKEVFPIFSPSLDLRISF